MPFLTLKAEESYKLVPNSNLRVKIIVQTSAAFFDSQEFEKLVQNSDLRFLNKFSEFRCPADKLRSESCQNSGALLTSSNLRVSKTVHNSGAMLKNLI